MIINFYDGYPLVKINGTLFCGCESAKTEHEIMALARQYSVPKEILVRALAYFESDDDDLNALATDPDPVFRREAAQRMPIDQLTWATTDADIDVRGEAAWRMQQGQ